MITEPRDVDSIGKLNEWIDTCGMPIAATATPNREAEVEHLAFGFGFRFPRADREAANLGYRALAETLARALYVRFDLAADDGAEVAWRIRPYFSEADYDPIETIDGSPIDWGRMENDPGDDDYRQTMIRCVETGERMGQIYARLMFIRARRTDAG